MAEDTNNITQTSDAPAPVAAAPAAPAAPVVAAPVAPAAPAYTVTPSASSGGGEGGGDNFMEILKSINWIEIVFGALGVYALFTVADFYRNNRIKVNPSISDIYNQMDKITIELSDVKTALQDQASQQKSTANTQGFI